MAEKAEGKVLRIVVATILGALGIGGVALFLFQKLEERWKGKTVAVLGERQVGKTHLIKFLTSGEIPENYDFTHLGKKFTGRTFKLEDLELKINDIVDLSGANDVYSDWKQEVLKADLVLYLFRADSVLQEEKGTFDRITNDMHQLKTWIEEKKRNPFSRILLYYIGTHIDLIPGYSGSKISNSNKIADKLNKLEIVKKMKLICKPDGLLAATMKDEIGTQKLVSELFKHIQDLK